MSGHEGHTMDDMMGMKMWFHGGQAETVLFKFWKTEKTGAFVGSLFIIFAMAFCYEALKYWRELLYQKRQARDMQSPPSNKSIYQEMLSGFHIQQTLLHMVQFVLSYLLMLIFMTYNIWLGLAITLGAGAGYFCFGWVKRSAVDITEHCK